MSEMDSGVEYAWKKHFTLMGIYISTPVIIQQHSFQWKRNSYCNVLLLMVFI